MIIVTGGAGFIGSNIVKGLNDRGITDILVVDDLEDGTKFRNIVDLEIADYLDKDEFRQALQLPHEDNIYVLLLDRQGQVLWRVEGAFTPEEGESLAAQIQKWQEDEAE